MFVLNHKLLSKEGGAAAAAEVLDKGDELEDLKKPIEEEPAKPDEEELKAKGEEEIDEEEDSKKRIRIPKARFDEVVRKAREKEEALNQKIIELTAEVGSKSNQVDLVKVQQTIEALQDKYEEQILDGDREAARKTRKDLNQWQDYLAEVKSTGRNNATKREAIDQLKYESGLAKYEGQYAELNPESEEFDDEKTDEVALLLESFVARGFNKAAALDKAVKYVMGEAKGDGSALRAAKDIEARKRGADADKRQPPATKGAGLDHDKAGGGGVKGVDIMRLSQEQFAKLDDQTKSSLRGDEL